MCLWESWHPDRQAQQIDSLTFWLPDSASAFLRFQVLTRISCKSNHTELTCPPLIIHTHWNWTLMIASWSFTFLRDDCNERSFSSITAGIACQSDVDPLLDTEGTFYVFLRQANTSMVLQAVLRVCRDIQEDSKSRGPKKKRKRGSIFAPRNLLKIVGMLSFISGLLYLYSQMVRPKPPLPYLFMKSGCAWIMEAPL